MRLCFLAQVFWWKGKDLGKNICPHIEHWTARLCIVIYCNWKKQVWQLFGCKFYITSVTFIKNMSETNEKPEVVNKDNTDESAAIDYLDDNEEEVTEEQNPSTTDVTNSSSTATSLLDLLNSNQNDIENFSEEFNTVLFCL